MATAALRDRLVAVLGAERVLASSDDLAYFGTDIDASGVIPLAVVRPGDVMQLQGAVRVCAAAGVAMIPRGGGASYSGGYIRSGGNHVLFDLGALNAIVVDTQNAVVSVGAGTTWAALRDALAPHGLRTGFTGPFSGIAATVGGSVSQHTVSHGSAAHGISAQSVLSMDVVLASGDLITTCAAAATRHFGPDLTGLFTGDCGALGIKATIRLPLIQAHDDFAALSFAFDSFSACHAGLRLAQLHGLEDSHFVLDRALSQGQIGRQQGFRARLEIASAVMRNAPRKLSGLRQLARMALAGTNPMQSGEYMAHFIVEGFDAADAEARSRRLRRLLARHGREIINSIPTFVRAVPFAPMVNALGPGGERWIPLHGVIGHRDATRFDTAFQALMSGHQPEMNLNGVWSGTMLVGIGSAGLLYEIALYWPGAHSPWHRRALGADHLGTLPQFADNPAATALVGRIRHDIIALFQTFGAGHFQIGRSYPYLDRLDPPAHALILAIKRELDPDGLMNPGALGL